MPSWSPEEQRRIEITARALTLRAPLQRAAVTVAGRARRGLRRRLTRS
jgi:hypothetical protein